MRAVTVAARATYIAAAMSVDAAFAAGLGQARSQPQGSATGSLLDREELGVETFHLHELNVRA